MDILIEFLTKNPELITSVIVIAGVLIVVILALIIIASLQGREVVLWPPKIGPKIERDSGQKVNITQTHSETDVHSDDTSIKLRDRVAFSETFTKRIEKAKEIWLLGINLDGIMSQYDGYISSKVKDGCKFKILITDPLFFENDDLILTAWPAGSKSWKDLSHSIGIMDNIINHADNENFTIRLTPYPPPYTLLAIDPETEHGEIQVEIYAFQPYSHNRPHFILRQKNSMQWYRYFLDDFKLAWKSARLHDPRKGLKPIKEKAGVVVYRRSCQGDFEFLLITARQNPNSWVFPGGLIEVDEEPEQTAIRECFEESGILVSIINRIGILELDKATSLERITFFLGTLDKETDDYETGRQRNWIRNTEALTKIIEDFRPVVIAANEVLKNSLN